MTIKELKDFISNLPDDTEIVYWNGDNGGWTDIEIDEIEYSTELDISGWSKNGRIIKGHFLKL